MEDLIVKIATLLKLKTSKQIESLRLEIDYKRRVLTHERGLSVNETKQQILKHYTNK